MYGELNMRLIDADAICKDCMDECLIADCGVCIIKEYKINNPIDAVPVVRCKDCKWYAPDTDWGFDEATGKRDHSKIIEKPYGECHGQDFHFTEDGCLRVGVDDFCSCGERRERDETLLRTL